MSEVKRGVRKKKGFGIDAEPFCLMSYDGCYPVVVWLQSPMSALIGITNYKEIKGVGRHADR